MGRRVLILVACRGDFGIWWDWDSGVWDGDLVNGYLYRLMLYKSKLM